MGDKVNGLRIRKKREKISSFLEVDFWVLHIEGFFMQEIRVMLHMKDFKCVSQKVFTHRVLLFLHGLLVLLVFRYWLFIRYVC